MTARDEALALLRERFPRPWRVAVYPLGVAYIAKVMLAHNGGEAMIQVEGGVESSTPQAAAWREARGKA